MAEQQAPRKAKLEICLEKVEQLIPRLRQISDAYQRVRVALHRMEADETVDVNELQLGMSLSIGEMAIALPFENAKKLSEVLQTAGASLGDEVIAIWNQFFTIAKEATEHCAAATAQVTQ